MPERINSQCIAPNATAVTTLGETLNHPKMELDTQLSISYTFTKMIYYSTREAAKKLGIPYTTLATYISVGKIQGPQTEIKGKTTTQIWTGEEIENVRKLLPKIANGRKTRYSKLREKQTAQPKKAVPRKTKAKKKT